MKGIIRIKTSPEIESYDYQKVCVALLLSGYWINHKKVYRIMSSHQLLNDRHQRPAREYVKYRKVSQRSIGSTGDGYKVSMGGTPHLPFVHSDDSRYVYTGYASLGSGVQHEASSN